MSTNDHIITLEAMHRVVTITAHAVHLYAVAMSDPERKGQLIMLNLQLGGYITPAVVSTLEALLRRGDEGGFAEVAAITRSLLVRCCVDDYPCGIKGEKRRACAAERVMKEVYNQLQVVGAPPIPVDNA